VKGQVLADFVTEFSPESKMEVICHVDCCPWKVFVEDASSAMGAGVEIVIITLEGIRLEHSFSLGFRAFNNEAEYEALLAGLRAVPIWVHRKLRFTLIPDWWSVRCWAVLKPEILE